MRISDWSSDVCSSDLGSFARALAKAARDNVGGGERLALAVSADLACEDAIGVGGKAPTKAADDPGKQGLAHEAGLAADDAAAHARLAGKAEEALDLAHRIAAARLRAGHAGKIGRAHVCTPVTNANLVCRSLLERKNLQKTHTLA